MHRKNNVAEKEKKSVILIGFMGSGKTTIGLRLSYKLRMPVEDTDKMIEKKAGKAITEIFAQDGEAAFRDMETNLLRELAEGNSQRILSVGGGTPLRPENQELLRKCGYVIYLRISPEKVYERLKGDKTRPLLQCDDPLAKITQLLSERQEKYEACADYVLDVDDKNEAECADAIVKALEARWGEERESV